MLWYSFQSTHCGFRGVYCIARSLAINFILCVYGNEYEIKSPDYINSYILLCNRNERLTRQILSSFKSSMQRTTTCRHWFSKSKLQIGWNSKCFSAFERRDRKPLPCSFEIPAAVFYCRNNSKIFSVSSIPQPQSPSNMNTYGGLRKSI